MGMINLKKEKCVQGFGGKHAGEKPILRPGCRWEDDIKMGLEETR
jgi:hypothetical protein